MIKNSIQLFNLQLYKNKNLIISLKQVFGINLYLAAVICKKFGLNSNSVIGDLGIKAVNQIRKFILARFVIQEQLRKAVQVSIAELSVIKSVRGLRHKLRLPVRGQRTRTNRRTVKKI